MILDSSFQDSAPFSKIEKQLSLIEIMAKMRILRLAVLLMGQLAKPANVTMPVSLHSGELHILHIDAKPTARSYDGHDWEWTQESGAELGLECDAGTCVVTNIPDNSVHTVTLHTAPEVAAPEKASRVHTPSTYVGFCHCKNTLFLQNFGRQRNTLRRVRRPRPRMAGIWPTATGACGSRC